MEMGFSKAYALKGGYQEWVEADFPLESKKAVEQNCRTCHEEITPQVVRDWESSRHGESASDVTCSVCHGIDHTNATNVDEAHIPTAKRCRFCHEKDWQSFQRGKHALAWKSRKEFPEYHYSRKEGHSESGDRTCAQCHKIGLKPASTTRRLWREQGIDGANSCANCHTAHAFSSREAARPEACRSCHTGKQTPQWESYAASRHFEVRRKSANASTQAQAPSCQTCHLSDGSHEVGTAWGSIGLRLPLPQEDGEWARARETILTAMRAYNPQNGSEKLLDTYRRLRFFPVEQGEWREKRRTMQRTCSGCHEHGFGEGRLREAEGMIRESDLLLARGIAVLDELYAKGHPELPEGVAFPVLMGVPGETAEAEGILRDMFTIHRKRVKSASFHAPGSGRAQEGMRALRGGLDRLKDLRQGLETGE